MHFRRPAVWLIALLVAVFGLGALAQQATTPSTNLIPRDVLFGNPEKASPQLSPTGDRIAYLAPDQKGVLNVWVRTLGKTDDKLVTSDKKRGIRSFQWQMDGEHILYVQDRDGDENWHIFQTNIASRVTRDLTAYEGATDRPTPAGMQARIVAYDEKFPDIMLVALNFRDPAWHDVYRLNLKTGALDLVLENKEKFADFTVDNDLKLRAGMIMTPDGGSIVKVRDTEAGPWREILKWGGDETLGGVFGFSPDNKALYIATSLDANTSRLLQVDLATGKQAVVAEDPDYDVGGALTAPKTNKLQAVGFVGDRLSWKIIDPAVKDDFEALKKVRNGDFRVISHDLTDRKWIVAYTVDNGPVYWYQYDRDTRKADVLFSNQPKLEQYKLAEMKPVVFDATDGMKIHAYVVVPAGSTGKNLPTVLFVHGGPWARDMWGYNPYAQWLANRGYAVMMINYRGSTGYGKKYLNAGDREWGGKMHQDLLDGKQWLVTQGIADPKKVCIMGGSYGGYATLAGVTFTPDAFTCGVDIVGPSNLVTLLKSIPPYWAPILSVFQKRMGRLDEEDFLKARSPLFKADQIRVPLMIGQGANDPRVNKKESDQIVEAMRKNNLPVDYYVFPDEGHGFARPENRMAFNAAVEQFLSRYLGGPVQPPTDDEAKLLKTVKQEPVKE